MSASTQSEITCREIVELVTDYLEFALPALERARFEQHLDRCDGCTTYLEQMRRTIRLTGTLTEASFSLAQKARLLEAFRDWKRDSATAG